MTEAMWSKLWCFAAGMMVTLAAVQIRDDGLSTWATSGLLCGSAILYARLTEREDT